MRGEVFSHVRDLNLRYVNLMSNICINGKFTSKEGILPKTIDENCEETERTEIRPTCEVIEKCRLGEKCCQLTKFRSDSHWNLKTLEGTQMTDVDALSYNSNLDVEYLLTGIQEIFPNLKVYDASNCAIRRVFKVNFESLHQLKTINLANNKISALNQIFYREMSLKKLDLCKYVFSDIFLYFTMFYLITFFFQPITESSFWKPRNSQTCQHWRSLISLQMLASMENLQEK